MNNGNDEENVVNADVPSGAMNPSTAIPEFYRPPWITLITNDSILEEAEKEVKLLEDEGRDIVWRMCSWFSCETRGVPGAACRLLERYLYIAFNENCLAHTAEFREKMHKEIPLLVASCITLTCKMSTRRRNDLLRLVHMVFICKKIKHTVRELAETEIKVCEALNYRIPLWTMVEKGEMLAMEVGFPKEKICKVAALIDIAEYRRHVITKKVQLALREPLNSTSSSLVSLHLIAGVLASVAEIYHCTQPTTLKHIGELTNASAPVMKCIRRIISDDILPNSVDRRPRVLKRK